ncbi:ABC transporter substrate-binding protein [Deinococcus deserti]|uniref:Putative amino acid ABC transporter, periplasmic component n=1 Tax=Deinococcus deserti (strain DSM 17065 / CIP 109153 / LMG 22923 / VCD115) TaxID=546414 RepID=C1D443_DEIDV|nr:ABC transporter substrate-binding protein [Deinococcus deserti]ACO47924.1 putative amino acid ABC transporter, periplasmic component [Deinococcus deserti VCD115]
MCHTRMSALLVLVPALCAAAPAHAATLAQVKASGVLRLATEGNYPPFNHYKNKALTGFEVELGNAIAKQLGVKPQWTTVVFESLLLGLDRNRYDLVIASHGITPERLKAVTFSTPHYCSGGVLVARPGGPRTLEDLKGKVVTMGVNTSYLGYVQKLPGIGGVKTFPTTNDQLNAVLNNRADAMVLDRFNAIDASKVLPGKLQIGDVVFPERIGMAMRRNNAELEQAVNRALATLMANGTYTKLSQAYFGQDVRCPVTPG